MSIATPFQGSLFANDFLRDAGARLDDWRELDADAIDAFEASARNIFNRFPTTQTPNESQTEDDLVWPVLAQLGVVSQFEIAPTSAGPHGCGILDSKYVKDANGP